MGSTSVGQLNAKPGVPHVTITLRFDPAQTRARGAKKRKTD